MDSSSPRFRRFALPALLTSLVLAAGWCYFRLRPHSIFRAVPAQTALVQIFSGTDDLNNWFSKDFQNRRWLRNTGEDARLTRQFFQKNASLLAALQQSPLLAAFSLLPSDSLHPLFVADAGKNIDLEQLQADSGLHVAKSVFKGEVVYTFSNRQGARMTLSRQRNLLLFSRYSFLVEDALVQLKSSEKWWYDQGFDISPAPTQVILRPEALAERVNNPAGPGRETFAAQLSAAVEWIQLSGSHGQAKLRPGTRPRTAPDARIWAVLPENIAWFAPLSFSAKDEDVDFQRYTVPWLDNDVATVLGEPHSGLPENRFLVLKIKDKSLAGNLLQAFGAERGLLKKYDYQTFEIRQFLNRSLLGPLVRQSGNVFQNPVCAVIEDYLVVAPGPSALELWIDKFIVGETMVNRPDFLQLNEQLAGDEGIGFFLLNTRYLSATTPSDSPAPLAEILAGFENTGLIACRVRAGNNRETVSLDFARQQQGAPAEGSIRMAWKTPLLGKALIAPHFVQGKAGGKVLVQDDQFHLYCLTAEAGGALLWRKTLDQPIVSAITGIDYFANGSTCFLFNTLDALWVLDEEGRTVSGFPLRLKSPATNGVTAVDFDDTRQYSFFIACANGNVYGFDRYGRPLPGWNPKTGAGSVFSPLVYFRKHQKDYLGVLSLEGRLSVFGRNGAAHFPPLQFAVYASPLQADSSGSEPRFACIGPKGLVHLCDLNGRHVEIPTSRPMANAPKLVFTDLYGDGHSDLAVLNGRELLVFISEKNGFSQPLVKRLEVQPDTIFYPGSGAGLGVFVRSKKQISLLDAGARYAGFPLAGTTPFTTVQAGGGRETLLFAGCENAVYAYSIGRKIAGQ